MKLRKPESLALLYRSQRIARRNVLSIGMMACIDFAHSGPAGLLHESDVWDVAARALGKGATLDEGNPKPQGEFKVYGAAHAPHGGEVGQLRVRVRVGQRTKELIVTGDRHFNALGVPSSPQPFTRMPIEPRTAFGGVGFADNPLGKGHAALERDGREVWPLPNVERDTQRLVTRGERIEPAGFWGLAATASPRWKHLGTCDTRWLENDWPHLPADTRLELFMSAPPDQWLPGFFTGDETFEIHHMHPQRDALNGRLPALRARCFMYGGQKGDETLREIPAHAETVWLFPELERGIVLYRALAEVADSDAADVSCVMAEWESLLAPALPFEHYRAKFFGSASNAAAELAAVAAVDMPAASAPSVAGAAPSAAVAVAAGASSAAVAAPAAAVVAAAPAAADKELAEVYAMVDDLNRASRETMAKHGLTERDIAPFLKEPEPLPDLSIEQVEQMAKDLDAQSREMMRKHNLTDVDLAPFLTPPPEPPAELADLQRLMTQVHAETRASMEKAGLTEADVRAWVATRPELADFAEWLPPPGSPPPQLDVASLALLDALPSAPPRVPAPAPGPVAPELPLALAAAPVLRLTREDVIARHAARQSLAGYDLSGLDLSGLDLTGATFTGALLEKTSFAKSKLADVDLTKALLKDADFTGADLQRARLAEASGGEGKFAQADLRGARLNGGDFVRANFDDARLEGADMSGAQFDGAALTRADATGCRAIKTQFAGCALGSANFSGAALPGANFSGSILSDCNFTRADCAHADFQGAQAQQTTFAEANLSASRADASACFDRARFTQARLNRASWDGIQMRGAVFERANLDDADFSNAVAHAAAFRLTSAKGAKFARADLSGADLTGINLFKGSLRKAKIDGAYFMHANLYGVDFEDVRPSVASVEGSNIDRTILKYRPPTA